MNKENILNWLNTNNLKIAVLTKGDTRVTGLWSSTRTDYINSPEVLKGSMRHSIHNDEEPFSFELNDVLDNYFGDLVILSKREKDIEFTPGENRYINLSNREDFLKERFCWKICLCNCDLINWQELLNLIQIIDHIKLEEE